MLELLYSPVDCIIQKHPIFDLIISHRDKLLSKACKYSFGSYAFSQISKAEGLEKKMNWEEERRIRKNPLDFCYIVTKLGSLKLNEYLARQKTWQHQRQHLYGVCEIPNCKDLYHIYPSNGELGYHGIINEQETSNELRLSSIPTNQLGYDIVMYYNKEGYVRHCREYREYTEWLEKRNVQRYVDVENHQQKIDGKNLLHCYRLIETGIEIAKEKTINVKRPNAEFLIGIRKGKYDLNKLLSEAKQKIDELNTEFDKTDLPYSVDKSFFKKLTTKIRKEYYAKYMVHE